MHLRMYYFCHPYFTHTHTHSQENGTVIWVQIKEEIRESLGDYKGFSDLVQPNKDEHGGRQIER